MASAPSSALKRKAFTDPWGREFLSDGTPATQAEADLSAAVAQMVEGRGQPSGSLSPEEDGEDQLSEEEDGAFTTNRMITPSGSKKPLPKIKLKVQPDADEPESEEETVVRPFNHSPRPPTQPAAESSSAKQPKAGGKTVPKAKQKEVVSIRDPPCWRCKNLNQPCETSSLRFSCMTCYKRHWACSTNPPPPRQKKGASQSLSVSAPPKTKPSLPATAAESISAAPAIRGRSPLRSASKPTKRPRSPSPSAPTVSTSVSASHPQNKKTRTSSRAVVKPQQQVNGVVGGSLMTPGNQLPNATELKTLKAQVGTLIQHDAQSKALLQRHSAMLEAVLENMKVLLGDKFIEAKGPSTSQALHALSVSVPSFTATAPDADIDELDELTPIERTPQPSAAPTPLVTVPAPVVSVNASGPNSKTNGSQSDKPVDRPPRIISVAPGRVPEKDHLKPSSSSGNGLHTSSNAVPNLRGGTATTTLPASLPYSTARDHLYKVAVSSSRTTQVANNYEGDEEADDDVRSVPAISALHAPASPTSSVSVEDPDGGYIADASHGPTPAPIPAALNKSYGTSGAGRLSPPPFSSHSRGSNDMQIDSLVQYPAPGGDDLDDEEEGVRYSAR